MTGIPLKIAAKVDPRDREYYESVRHLLEAPGVEFIGEIDQRQKDAFLGQACALIFPIRWPEPFGLVMIEAMATGTPVIAGRFGSVPEVLDDGVTGFICDSNEEMALAIERVHELDRARCRAVVEERFSASSMADGYEAMYRRLINRRPVEELAGIARERVRVLSNGEGPRPALESAGNGAHPVDGLAD
jgi:glycosyltransferase involved in cell wall biosynthesis